MPTALFAWYAPEDLEALKTKGKKDLGPIANALEHRQFDQVELLANTVMVKEFSEDDPKTNCEAYAQWLRSRYPCSVRLHWSPLDNPTNHEAIHKTACEVVDEVMAADASVELTFHLSPGTPSQHAIWFILSKSKYPSKLLMASERGETPEERVFEVDLPFEVSGDYLSEVVARSDEFVLHKKRLGPESPEVKDILHGCPAMEKAVVRARILAPAMAPALILGESGTGKDLFAKAIHSESERKGRYIAINCGAIPSELVESELFGHKRGAFTGADKDKKGLFLEAKGGTVFLDEIGELPLRHQVKLLRVLQEKEVTPVGGFDAEPIDVRIVAATHRDVYEQVRSGAFRQDLFHRVAVGVIELPPLRDRGDDLALLVDVLWKKIQSTRGGQDNPVRILSPGAMNILKAHPWPGNVRELENVLTRVNLWSTRKSVGKREVEDAILPLAPIDGDRILDRSLDQGVSIEAILSDVARHYLQRALEKSDGNRAKVARLLDLSHGNTVDYWMKKHGVEPLSKTRQ